MNNLLEAKNIENLKNNFNPKLIQYLRSIGLNSININITSALINFLIDTALQKSLSKSDQEAIQKLIAGRLHTQIQDQDNNSGNNKDQFEVDEKTYTVKLPNNKDLHLPKIEFELLKFLWQYPNKIHSKEEILDRVYGEKGANVFDNTVTVQISRLNSKLPDNRKIQSKKGVGYYIKK